MARSGGEDDGAMSAPTTVPPNWGPVWLPGVVVLVMASAVRVARYDLWLDEAFSLAATHRLWETLNETHATMALYYAVLTPWSAISQSPVWLRSLSVLFMVLGTAVFAATVCRQAGPTAGRLAGLLAGCSPIVVQYAVEARSFALVVLLTAIGWYSLDRSIEDDRSLMWPRLFVVVAALLPLAHGLAIIQVGAMAVAVTWSRPPIESAKRLMAGFVASGLVITTLLVIGASEVGNWIADLSIGTTVRFLTDLTHPIVPIAALLLGLATLGARYLMSSAAGDPLSRFRQVALILWGPGAALGLIVLSAARPSLLGRYALASALGMVALASIAIVKMDWPTRTIGLLVAAAMLFSQIGTDWRVPTWTTVVAKINHAAEPGDAIAFGAPDARIPFEAAWTRSPDAPRLELVGPGLPLGAYDRFADSDAESMIQAMMRFERVWIVDQRYAHQPSRYRAMVTDPRIVERFTIVDEAVVTTDISDISIVLLQAE